MKIYVNREIFTLEKIEVLQNVIEYPLKIIPYSTEILNVTILG